jgi:hypothetical protein
MPAASAPSPNAEERSNVVALEVADQISVVIVTLERLEGLDAPCSFGREDHDEGYPRCSNGNGRLLGRGRTTVVRILSRIFRL